MIFFMMDATCIPKKIQVCREKKIQEGQLFWSVESLALRAGRIALGGEGAGPQCAGERKVRNHGRPPLLIDRSPRWTSGTER